MSPKNQKNVGLFPKGNPYKRSNCCSRMFFGWVSPVIKYTKKHKTLQMDVLGNLREKDEIEPHTERLTRVWANSESKNLFRSILWSFKGDYFYLMFLNAI